MSGSASTLEALIQRCNLTFRSLLTSAALTLSFGVTTAVLLMGWDKETFQYQLIGFVGDGLPKEVTNNLGKFPGHRLVG